MGDRLRVGRAGHTGILEPEKFLAEYVLWDGGARRGKEWTSFKASADKTILTEGQYGAALAMRDAVMAHPEAAAILVGAATEQTLTWTDPVTGLACKCRVDLLKPRIWGDLKTTRSVGERAFTRQSIEYGWDIQMGFYQMGLRANGMPDAGTVIIGVEVAPPHDVIVFDAGDLAYCGAKKARVLLDRVAECEATGQWPGRSERRVLISVPEYAMDGYECEDEQSPAAAWLMGEG